MPAAVAVAASGGRDSTALLHATACAARGLGLQVHALHVHHGLVLEADDWLRQLRGQCQRWARAGLPLSFHHARLSGRPADGESVEAWARRERYRALAEMAKAAGCSLVLLAHHRRDQAETLLLQALRGGGPAGLAAMPRRAQRAGLTWARPWLNQPRQAIEAYVQRHRLRYVDDTSNADPRFARNRLRLLAWPALHAAFADLEPQLVAAATRAQEAAAALQELAAADLAAVAHAEGLQVSAWQLLSPARRSLVLRHWLQGLGAAAAPQGVPESLVQRLCAELQPAQAGQWPLPLGTLRLHAGRLVFFADPARPVALAAGGPGAFPVTSAAPRDVAGGPAPLWLDLRQVGDHVVPGWPGVLRVRPCVLGEGGDVWGLEPSLLSKICLRAREGGEQFQAGAGRPARSLKKQFQAAGVPAWQRGGPLVLGPACELLFVPGLGLDARWAQPAAPGLLALDWCACP
jgi:tRNA(Ile)-lysidine synthase